MVTKPLQEPLGTDGDHRCRLLRHDAPLAFASALILVVFIDPAILRLRLLATSSDAALRKLKAGPWKQIQRLNYALFALVLLHAFFYGALLRASSPYTLLLGLSVLAVFAGQAVGIRLWRRRHSRVGRDPLHVSPTVSALPHPPFE
jgi:DMSO/TMAO reductase YedYZ heme-binding membrane subunit